jgi:hypothetical protein
MLKRVKYRVLFVKREYEASFYENEDVIDDNFDGSALIAWKTAEFMQNLQKHGEKIPPEWEAPYPDGFRDRPSEGRFNGFPPEEKKYPSVLRSPGAISTRAVQVRRAADPNP